LEKAELENKANIARQRGIIGTGAIGLLSIGFLSLMLFQNNQKKKKTNAQLSQQNIIIAKKSQQNELLLKEIHHRVKNNLQTISSLLYLQSSNIDDKEVKQAVASGQHRVETMALIHQKLYQRENLSAIEMKDYLGNLTNSLISAFGNSNIDAVIDMPETELDIDTAVPLGLISNELITNSMKYGFPNDEKGKVEVSLREIDDGQMRLRIADSGIGKNNDTESNSFGTKLINMLVKQLNGKLTSGNDGGHWVEIVVPPTEA